MSARSAARDSGPRTQGPPRSVAAEGVATTAWIPALGPAQRQSASILNRPRSMVSASLPAVTVRHGLSQDAPVPHETDDGSSLAAARSEPPRIDACAGSASEHLRATRQASVEDTRSGIPTRISSFREHSLFVLQHRDGCCRGATFVARRRRCGSTRSSPPHRTESPGRRRAHVIWILDDLATSFRDRRRTRPRAATSAGTSSTGSPSTSHRNRGTGHGCRTCSTRDRTRTASGRACPAATRTWGSGSRARDS